MEILTSLIGFIAATLTTIAFLPQVIKVWKSRSARDISLGMYCLFSSGVLLWLVYGIMLAAWPIIVANLITLLLALLIVGGGLRFAIELLIPPSEPFSVVVPESAR